LTPAQRNSSELRQSLQHYILGYVVQRSRAGPPVLLQKECRRILGKEELGGGSDVDRAYCAAARYAGVGRHDDVRVPCPGATNHPYSEQQHPVVRRAVEGVSAARLHRGLPAGGGSILQPMVYSCAVQLNGLVIFIAVLIGGFCLASPAHC
jgi:hypothetical protein